MAGKGKGFLVSRGKAAFKSPPATPKQPPLNGNGDSLKKEILEIESSDSESDFVKAKVGTSSKVNRKASKESPRTVKKPSLASLKTGVKSSLDTPTSEGDLGKSGRAYSSGKGGGKSGVNQASAGKPPIKEVELKLEIDLPENAKVIMDCEAAAILQRIQESLTVLSDDPNVKMPDSFEKASHYCKVGNTYSSMKSAREVLETLKNYGVSDGELCMIGNVCPESIDEVYALIPSLKAKKHKNEGPIREVLASLANLKHSQ